ncbi:DNA methyltransferase 1-associated protein 1, partial [Globisporangium splendens]
MSDVAQILGITAPAGASAAASAAAGTSELEKLKPSGTSHGGGASSVAKNSKQKKLSGMQREVLELLESTHRVNHSLYPGLSRLSLQQKWKQRKGVPAVKWLRKPFRNPARVELAGENDGATALTLQHWVKAHVEPPDYVFARFNVKCDVTKYTAEEYEHALASHQDPQMKWTKDETDVLMGLCARYDLRWIIIADKYNTNPIAKGAFRSVEEIKYRYYEVTRLLGEYRDRVATAKQQEAEKESSTNEAAIKQEAGGGNDAAATASASASASADPAKPSATSTPAQPSPSTTATNSTPDKYYKFNINYEKQRKRQLELAFTRSIEEEHEIRRLNDELKTVEQQLKKAAVKVDSKKKKELADVPYEIHRELPRGVLLRSSLLSLPQQKHTLSAKLIKKMELMLDELGVPTRPMPTKATCEMYDALRKDIVGLMSLRKHLTAKQAEAQVLKDRFKSLTGSEFKPVSTPIRRAEHRGDNAPATVASAAGGTSSSPAPISQGKALKHSEKAFRTSTKRRGAGTNPGIPSKRNKKML